MKGPLGNIMRQAQEMQEKLKSAQEALATAEVTGSSGGGLVEVTMTGRHDVRRVSIDSALMGDDKEVLEDMVAAAVNDAVRRVEKVTQEKMGGLTAGLNIPGLNIPGING
ncbi:MAG: YbaB/EbfC family nucleoid-associated protein [Arenicellales bacterium]